MRNLLPVLGGTAVCGYLAMVFYAISTFPAEKMINSFLWPYSWEIGFLWLLRSFPALVAAGVIASIPFLAADRIGSPGSSRPIAAQILGATVAYLGLLLVAAPIVRGTINSRQDISHIAKPALLLAQEAIRDDRLDEALGYMKHYLTLDPRNNAVRLLMDEIDTRRSSADPPAEASVHSTDASHALDRARAHLANEQFYSALHYATQAYQLGPSEAARQIAEQARASISTPVPTGEDLAAARLFELKKQGNAALRAGNFVEAFYLLQELAQEFVRDAEISRLLALSREKIAETEFFCDEVAPLEGLPGTPKLVFINRRDSEGAEIVFAEKMIELSAGVYFTGVAVFRYDSTGLRSHTVAPFGKILSNRLTMRCLHRTSQDRAVRARYLVGAPPRNEEYSIPLMMHLAEIPMARHLSLSPTRVQAAPDGELAGIGNLLAVRTVYQRFGHPAVTVDRAIIELVFKPPGFLAFVLLAGAFGAWGRSGVRNLSVPLGVASIPILALICFFFFELILLFVQKLAGLLAAHFSLALSVVLIVLVGAVLVLLSLRQFTKALAAVRPPP